MSVIGPVQSHYYGSPMGKRSLLKWGRFAEKVSFAKVAFTDIRETNIGQRAMALCSTQEKRTKNKLTVSGDLAETISCRARTDNACSSTNTHTDTSNGRSCVHI